MKLKESVKIIWKPIVGYEDMYEVNNFGAIKSIKRNIEVDFYSGKFIRPLKEKISFGSKYSNGYMVKNLFKNKKSKRFGVHRLVAMAFIPNPDNKPEVNHINGIKHDNRVENLEWATKSENAQHAWNTGLYFFDEYQRKQISNRNKGRLINNKRVINIVTGDKYDSIHEASKKLNIPSMRLYAYFKTGNFFNMDFIKNLKLIKDE